MNVLSETQERATAHTTAPLKAALSLQSPSLIELRPPCPFCRQRTAFFKFTNGQYAYCRECFPAQINPDEEYNKLRENYDNTCRVPVSEETFNEILDTEEAPFVSNWTLLDQIHFHIAFTMEKAEAEFWASFQEWDGSEE